MNKFLIKNFNQRNKSAGYKVKIPHTCPVCKGHQSVPNGFYRTIGSNNWSTGSTLPETCRTCNGTGVVWSEEEIRIRDFIKKD
jgi:DnaJ-class molecular chaperone